MSYVNLGKIRLAQGRVKEAEYFFKRAMVLKPEYLSPYMSLLKYYIDHGMQAKAGRFIRYISKLYCGDYLISQLYAVFPETVEKALQPE